MSPRPGGGAPGKAGSLLASFGYAGAGVWRALRRERNMRIHLGAALLVVVFGVWLRVSAAEWLALILAMAIVTAAELFNTALEAAVDLAMPERHPLAKRAKDSASGAVLVLAIGAAVVAALVFLPRLAALVPAGR